MRQRLDLPLKLSQIENTTYIWSRNLM